MYQGAEYFREYRALNRQRMRDYNRIYNKAYRKKNGYGNEKRWVERNEYKVWAHQQLHTAIRNKSLKKEPCEVCANPVARAHHDDYRKPLAVRWLCAVHHTQTHLVNKEQFAVLNKAAEEWYDKEIKPKLRMRRDPHPERLALVIKYRKEGKTLQEIGEIFNISRERVRQLLLDTKYKQGRRKFSPLIP